MMNFDFKKLQNGLFGSPFGVHISYDMKSDDMALVREYSEGNSERAFATLVSKHVNLVYSVRGLPTSWSQQASRVAGILTKSVLMYAAQNNGQLPTSISAASDFFKDTQQPDAVAQDEAALAESARLFELVSQGPTQGLTNAHNVVLIRQIAPLQRADGMYERAYGFADGHAEVWVNPDAEYSDKETRRPTYNDTNTTNRLSQVGQKR